jgi:hypothetical protein
MSHLLYCLEMCHCAIVACQRIYYINVTIEQNGRVGTSLYRRKGFIKHLQYICTRVIDSHVVTRAKYKLFVKHNVSLSNVIFSCVAFSPRIQWFCFTTAHRTNTCFVDRFIWWTQHLEYIDIHSSIMWDSVWDLEK